MCTQFPDLLDEATDALLAYAWEFETRAERIMEAAIPAKFHPAA